MRSTTTPDRAAPSAEARRWRHSVSSQQRGRDTANRFAEATEVLLQTRPFEEISVRDIVRQAGRPVGSFYARFGSKEALLPFLYQRYHEGLEPLVAARLARVDWGALGLDAAIAALVDVLIGQFDERRWLIRALALFARTRPAALPADLVERRRQVFDHAVRVLAPHRAAIAHADAETAIRFAVYVVTAVAREKLVFGEAPHSRVTPMSRQALRDELVRLFRAYLSAAIPS